MRAADFSFHIMTLYLAALILILDARSLETVNSGIRVICQGIFYQDVLHLMFYEFFSAYGAG